MGGFSGKGLGRALERLAALLRLRPRYRPERHYLRGRPSGLARSRGISG